VLVESNENKNFGIIIYSENKFDFVTNFTMVNKSEPDVHEHIDFKEVSKFISRPLQKNLILYRLLTNDENLDPFSSKLGYFIKEEKKIEVVYFDPIFVVKDIENLKISIPEDKFRFKIQQVGYRTKSFTHDSAIYEETFSIDLSDIEAKNQNDSIFAETMLSFNVSAIKKNKKSNSKIKNETFNNLSSVKEREEKDFYHLDGSEENKNSSFIKKSNRDDKYDEEGDFFSRVILKNERKEFKSSTLKMFK
jgi:hypothetical protein